MSIFQGTKLFSSLLERNSFRYEALQIRVVMEQALFITIGQLLKSRFKDQTLFLKVGG